MRFSVASALTAALCIVSASARLLADQQQGIDIQNKGRQAKGLPYLTWDTKLVASAQQCANKIASTGNFAHCQSAENLYAQYGSTAPPLAAAAQAWMNEAPSYHGEVIPQGDFSAYGHYSECLPSKSHPPKWSMLTSHSPIHVEEHPEGRHGHRQGIQRLDLRRRSLRPCWQCVSCPSMQKEFSKSTTNTSHLTGSDKSRTKLLLYDLS